MTSKLKYMDKKPWNSKFDLTGPLNNSLSWNRAMAINICSFVSCSLLFIMCWLFLVRLNRNFSGSEGMSGSPSPGDLHPQNSCSVRWSLTLCNPEIPGTDHTDRNTSIICLERVMHPVIWRMLVSLQNIRAYSFSVSIFIFHVFYHVLSLSLIPLLPSLILSTPFFVSTFFWFCWCTLIPASIHPSSSHEARCMLIFMYARVAYLRSVHVCLAR